MVDETVINTVLRKFLTSPRQPKYLQKPEYAHMQERNKEIYMSSAYFKSSWAYRKAQSYTVNSLMIPKNTLYVDYLIRCRFAKDYYHVLSLKMK